MKHSKVAHSPICAWCFQLIDDIHIYGLSRLQPRLGILLIRHGNPCPVYVVRGIVQLETNFYDKICQQLMLTGVAERYGHICGGPFPLDFHKVPYSPKSYATPEQKAWSALANCGFKQAGLHCSVVTWHLKSVVWNLLQKTSCRKFLYAVQP